MNDTELFKYQVESMNKSIMKILEDMNRRLCIIEDKINADTIEGKDREREIDET